MSIVFKIFKSTFGLGEGGMSSTTELGVSEPWRERKYFSGFSTTKRCSWATADWGEKKTFVMNFPIDASVRILTWFVWHQHGWCTEHVTEWIIEKIEHCCSINVRIADNLGRKESLARSWTEETAHNSVSQIHFVRHFTHGHADFTNVWFDLGRAVKISVFPHKQEIKVRSLNPRWALVRITSLYL